MSLWSTQTAPVRKGTGSAYGNTSQYGGYYADAKNASAPRGATQGGAPAPLGDQQSPHPSIEGNHEQPEYDIYDRAVNVSSPRMAEDQTDVQPATVTKTVVRRVEVPFTRKVKVPTTTTRIVPTKVRTKVPVTRFRNVTVMEDKEETFVEYEDREMVRDKEIWVKKIVPEKYIQKVPVQRKRVVQVPVQKTESYQGFTEVEVQGEKQVEVEGYRIDEVEDTKVVEVEEQQQFQTKLEPTGQPQLLNTRDVGRVPKSHIGRRQGDTVIDAQHPAATDIDEDSDFGDVAPSAPRGYAPSSRAPAPRQSAPPTQTLRQSRAPRPQSGSFDPYATSYKSTFVPKDAKNASYNAAGDFRHHLHGPDAFEGQEHSVGVSVKDTHTRHTSGVGVMLTNVERGSPAARAGLVGNDILTAIGGARLSTVQEFREALANARGPLPLQVNRDGRRLNLTLQP